MPYSTKRPVKQQLSFFDPVEVPLTQEYIALVDLIDIDLLEFNWCVAGLNIGHPEAFRRKNGQGVHLHRVIMARKLGRDLLPSEHVDHIDGNPLNDCRDNLRLATHQQNTRNRKRSKNIRSGFKGAYPHEGTSRWMARICVNGKLLNLGFFATPEEAHAAYCEAAKKYFGEFARFE